MLTKPRSLCYNYNMEKTFRPVLSIRIFGEEKCFGPGVAELLRRVRKEKSLRAAAISISMAYSKAWKVIKSSEAELGFKLLVSTTGGKNGGGAVLSPEAERLLAAYDAYCCAVKDFAAQEFVRSFDGIL